VTKSKGYMLRTYRIALSFVLFPVDRGFRSISAVLRISGLLAIVEVVLAATSCDLRLGERNGASCAGDLALEAVHVDLLAATERAMNPEPCASASTRWACGHASGDLVDGGALPGGGVVDREHGKILRADRVDLRRRNVCDGETGALEIPKSIGVVLRHGLAGADAVVRVLHLATVKSC
jgi:hypothetical protein